MPSPQPPPVWGRIDLYYASDFGWSANNRFYYTTEDAGTNPHASIEAFVQAFIDGPLQAYKGVWAADVHAVVVRGAIRTVSELVETSVPREDEGSISGQALPGQDVGIITWGFEAATGDRISRGRTNVSGLPEANCEGGLMTDTLHENMEDLADALQVPIEAGGSTFQLAIHVQSPNTLRLTTHGNVNPVIKTLRRRRPVG